MTTTAPFINLHALHALPASLVNRDINNNAKTITFGGVRRIRVSSQSWKRAIVQHMRAHRIDGGEYSLRTAKFPALTAHVLADTHHRDLDVALAKTAAVYSALGLKAKENGNTAVAIYSNEAMADRVAAAINEHWDHIGDSGEVKDITKESDAKSLVPDTVVDAARSALDVGKAVDLALTGRMLAEIPGTNVDGALNYGHAFSVHPGAVESDFFTAVDDAATDDEPVSSNLGDVDLSAPLLYRSASIDQRLLARNLSTATDPDALAADAVAAFLTGFIEAVPAAKHTSTNASTLPSLLIAVQSRHAESAANAFHTPVNGDNVLADAARNLTTLIDRQKTMVRPDDTVVALVLDPALDSVIADAGIETATSLTDLAKRLR